MPAPLQGILVALITPFTEDGAIDAAALDAHINRFVDAGVHGLVPGGSTGEFTAGCGSIRRES
jgi:dihydrodipicolinate synthase/N-acetylneuraminate lyase